MSADSHIIKIDLFPKQLKEWGAKPDVLWYSGDLTLLNRPMVAVVGSRNASKEGLEHTRRITRALISKGICVVSGLAEGVDAVAHLTALRENGTTIAVMGTPIDECYPAIHSQLKADIEEKGLVLSQFHPNTAIQKSNFPRRNELMAALSTMTIVVEASINSGTRHQVKCAIALGRAVGFLPSLVNRGFPWVDAAMNSGLGFAVKSPKDLLAHLEKFQLKKTAVVSINEVDQLVLIPQSVSQKSPTVSSPPSVEKEEPATSNQVGKLESQPQMEPRRSNYILAVLGKLWKWLLLIFRKDR